MNTLEAIRARHTTRAFSARQISAEDLDAILFAGGQAAVGGADFKSLKIYAVQDPEVLRAIDEASAKMGHGSHPIYGAPTLIVLAGRESILPNIHFTNAGCVLENMLVAAADLGIDSGYLWLPMFGINSEPKLMERLRFPEGFTCIGTVALGYAEKEFKKPRGDELRIIVKYI